MLSDSAANFWADDVFHRSREMFVDVHEKSEMELPRRPSTFNRVTAETPLAVSEMAGVMVLKAVLAGNRSLGAEGTDEEASELDRPKD